MNIRKQARRERALARYPKSPKSRTGRRTEAQWIAEHVRLEALVKGGK